MDAQYKKFAADRISHLLECCDYALDAEAVRANQAELRLASVRDTLATVRVQHEVIYRKYEDLALYSQELEKKFDELRRKYEQKSGGGGVVSYTVAAEPREFENSRDAPNYSDSVVKRMRAQLEENTRKLGVTPVAKRTRTTVQITKSFA